MAITYEHAPVFSGAATYTLTAADVTANVKGAYTQVHSSLTADCSVWWFHPTHHEQTEQYLWDVATGAAASEVVLVANFPLQGQAPRASGADSMFRCHADIESGTRVAVRVQADSPWIDPEFSMLFQLDALAGSAGVVTYGADTATSGGTLIDADGTADTKGAYVQLTSSSTAAHAAFTIAFAAAKVGPSLYNQFAVDLSTGAAASEVVLIPNIGLRHDTNAVDIYPHSHHYEVPSVASSTRLAMRAACDTNTAGQRTFDCILYGMDDISPQGAGGGGGASHASMVSDGMSVG